MYGVPLFSPEGYRACGEPHGPLEPARAYAEDPSEDSLAEGQPEPQDYGDFIGED